MNRRFLTSLSITFGLVLALSSSAYAQRVYLKSQNLVDSPFGILNNSIANLHAEEGAIWVGPFLNYSTDQGASWYVPDSDSLFGTVNRLFSMDVEGDVVVAGIGRTEQTGGQNVQTAAGFLISEDAGQTFQYRFPQLDGPEDNVEEYGVSLLPALPVIVPQQSPPFDIDFDAVNGDIWVAGWASGIRRSADMGRTWSRVVLPPDNLDLISPENEYSFPVEPQRGSTGSLNHMGFSVLVDKEGTVWAGTAGGLNRSTDGGTAWRRFKTDGTDQSLTGNWIISLEEQRSTTPSTIWAASWNTGESGGAAGQYGVTVLRNGGSQFQQTLLGERIYDFAFDGATVYAAGDNGLFISDDGGRTWDSISQFKDSGPSGRTVRPQASIFSVEIDGGVLWVGSSDGLLRSLDGGQTWTIFHVNVPLHPDQASDRVPDVNTYAYHNPFSKGGDVFVRIKFEASGTNSAQIRLFDFGMNVVREMTVDVQDGVNEVTWDGTDASGINVPNGAYFYEVSFGNRRERGKILVIE
jgi:hypothetical protein